MSFWGSFWFWVHIIIWIIALILAYAINCPGGRALPMIGAFIFPEIYLIQYAVRRWVVKEPGYGIPWSCRYGPKQMRQQISELQQQVAEKSTGSQVSIVLPQNASSNVVKKTVVSNTLPSPSD